QIIDASGVEISRKPVQVTQIEDRETFVTLSPLGGISRSDAPGLGASLSTSLRKDVGLVLEDGRAIQVHVSDLPTQAIGFSAENDASEFLGLKSAVVGIVEWQAAKTYALGTRSGVVKRITGPLPDKHEVSLIALKEGDSLIGITETAANAHLVFVTDAANALVLSAEAVRAQGLAAAGMAGMNTGDSRAIFFGSGNRDSLLLTAANNSQALGATDPGSWKLTPLSAFPSKGRGSMGVRCQRLLKGEDQLYFAGVVSAEPVVLDPAGQTLDTPQVEPKRDASGSTAAGYIQGAC
ncbi:MAG: DNA gyrase C-terminal beta-propeller domain-containing protein, partial [Aquiluna sp.]